MSVHVKKFHAALKHGAFSATTILPGEDPTAFKKTHEDIIAELAPDGALEDDVVWTLAHLVWRKKNLATPRIAELALVEIGETATMDRLLQDLSVVERLDAMIDKCLKRFLFLKGLKSLQRPPPPVPGT